MPAQMQLKITKKCASGMERGDNASKNLNSATTLKVS